MAQLKSFYEEENGETGAKTYIRCFTCAHCNRIFKVPDVNADRGFCLKCMHHTCLRCGGSERCAPFEKKIEAMEAGSRQAARFMNQVRGR